MGRSAKITKRPTKKEKTTSKLAKINIKSLPPPPPPPPTKGPEAGVSGPKKRKTLRVKAEKKSKM
ncbi:hypothetical protein M231_01722 [Tremella mesenterica]|uniref:Uncharacterized protein n=1 Tax=Tremella mesenterica TaxID=5217 RepID=A0A4Q1BS84_TREME|nr:hypothetical protein M231_01722 [Tremella mesenterica]